MVNDIIERKETPCQEVLGARGEAAKDKCMEAYKKKTKVKKCICQTKKGVNEHSLYHTFKSREYIYILAQCLLPIFQ